MYHVECTEPSVTGIDSCVTEGLHASCSLSQSFGMWHDQCRLGALVGPVAGPTAGFQNMHSHSVTDGEHSSGTSFMSWIAWTSSCSGMSA